MDEKFMQAAIEEAKKAKDLGDLPFGAVVVCEGEIVGRGKAEDGTVGDVTAHAELLAVRSACEKLGTNDLQNCMIYCTNEPCNMCAAGIFQAKISQVIIGLTRDDLPRLLRARKIQLDDLARDSGYEIKILKGVLKDQILELFKDIKK